jgi:hypothetical protein
MTAHNLIVNALIFLMSVFVLQVIWTLANPPLLQKPRTWFIHWSLKANFALIPAIVGLSYL